MSVEKEIRKILGEATPAASRAKQELVRLGLGHDKNAAATMAALKNPEEAMKSPAKRELLLKVMQDLLDVVVNDPSMVMKTKTALRKEEVEEIEEKLVGGQKKIDANKNGKLDAEDFKKLRAMKKEEEEKSEAMIEAKMSKKDDEDEEEEEDEDEKEMEDDEEEDEVELSKDQVEKMIAAMKKTKGFKAHIKTLKGAEEGYVSHAQRKAVWASRNDAKMKKEEVQLEQAPVAPAPIKHRIAVTVSEPDHPMVTKRKEQVLKHVVVSHGPDKAGAQKVGEKFYKKKGYKVHGSEHAGIKEDVQIDEAAWGKDKAGNLKAALSRHSEKAIAANKAGDDSAVKVHQSKINMIKNKMAKMAKESVTTDYSMIKGQSQNKTPTQKLATDYKLATKKTQKEEVQIDELDTSTVKSYLDKVRFKQARSAVQANMGTPGMKKKHSAELEKTAKSMETAKKRLTKEEVQVDEASQFKSKEDAIKYAKEKVKTHRDNLDGIEIHAHSGSFNVNHTSNSSGRNSLKKMGAKHITTVYKEEIGMHESDASWAASKEKEKEKRLTSKDQDSLAKIRGMMAKEKVAKMKEEVQVDEAGPFSYGKPPRKGSVADLAAKKRKEQEKGKMPIEPKDQMVGNAKVVKEAFPTVDDAKKRMKDALKSKFDKNKISTGTVYTKKYKEEPEDEKKSDK